MTKAEWIKLLAVMAPDEGERLTQEDKEQALALAVTRYGADRPLLEAADVATGDGYTVPLPDAWVPEFSRVTGMELPGQQAGGKPYMLSADGFKPHRIPGRDVLLLVWPQPMGEVIRLHFTLPHVLDDDRDTVPALDREAVAHWAAGLLLDQLAAMHTGDKQSTLQSDSVDHAAKGPNYKALAEGHRQQYWNHLGIDPKRTVAAGAVVSIGERRLLHRGPRNRRRS